MGEAPPAWAVPLLSAVAALAPLTAAVAALAPLPAAVAALTLNLTVESARAWNGSAAHGTDALRPVPSPANVLPTAVWFPATRNSLIRSGLPNLTNMRANNLLAFYGLPPIAKHGLATLQAKRLAIANHIGVRL